jgi:calcineurin-like phosphoesterase family protein
MVKTWVTADWHFGGKHHWREQYEQLSSLYSGKVTPLAFEEEIIRRHNSLVHKNDVVYVLGDACMSEDGLGQCARMNGNLYLVAGNHDIYHAGQYLKAGFQNVASMKIFPGLAVLTHCPVHPSELSDSWGKLNIHGHLHGDTLDNPYYVCVSLEQQNYYPVELIKSKPLELKYHQ